MHESVLGKLGNQLRWFLLDLIGYLYSTKFLWLCWFLRWLTGLGNNVAGTSINEGHDFLLKINALKTTVVTTIDFILKFFALKHCP